MSQCWGVSLRRLRLCVALSLGLLATCAKPLAAQGDFPAAKPRTAGGGAARHYFAVMGEVIKPGVYEEQTPFPRLVELVLRAGSLTDQATGNVRIIRHGRIQQQTFLTAESDVRLMSGDVVVLDGKLARDGDVATTEYEARSGRSERSSGAQSDPAQVVQLAFVGLVDHPIVVAIPGASDATLPRIVELLGQSSAIVPRVRVIETDPRRRFHHSHPGENVPLASGSVLVFDQMDIAADHIPETLPQPIPADWKSHSTQGPRSMDSGRGDRRGPKLTFDDRADEVIASSTPDFSGSDFSQELSSLPTDHDPQSIGGETLEFGTQVDRGVYGAVPEILLPVPLNENESNASPVRDWDAAREGLWSLRQREPRLENSSEQQQINESEILESAIAKLSDEKDSRGSADLILVVVLGCVAGVVGFSVIWSIMLPYLHRVRVTPAMPRVDMLEALIHNQLPIVEEPCLFQTDLTFYGRTSSQRKIRIDAAHETAAPHSPAEGESRRTEGQGSSPRRPHFLDAQAKTVQSQQGQTAHAAVEGDEDLLGRVLWSIRGESPS